MKAIWSRIRLRARVLAGKLYNLAGIPGLVRDCDYAASAHDVRIQVRAREMFTIITVNGLDVYFHRLTGTIDGVGLGDAVNLPPVQARQSIRFPEPSEFLHHNSQKHIR
jgi:hypothetical protein